MRLLRGCGLGDTILLLGAAVYLSIEKGPIKVITSPAYLRSISDLLVNHPEVIPFTYLADPRSDNSEPLKLFDAAGGGILQSLLGPPPLWYEKMGIPFGERWASCPVEDALAGIEPSYEHPVFIHDDPGRGFNIPVKGYRPPVTASIVDHAPVLKGASEIHVMDSSFFNLIESMNYLNAELFYYPGVKGCYPYDLKRHKWNVVSS